MNNEMTLDKAVKLSDEELGTVAGGLNGDRGEYSGEDTRHSYDAFCGSRRKLRYNNGQHGFAISEAAVRRL